MLQQRNVKIFPPLQLLASLAALIMLAVIIRQARPEAVKWDVTEFSYSGYSVKISGLPGTDEPDRRVVAKIVYADATGGNSLDIKETGEEEAFSAGYLLDRLGNDGWEPVWSDGTQYIVKRPQGRWLHDNFDVRYEPETNSAAQ